MCKWGTDKEVMLCKPLPISGRKMVKVDACIARLVQTLNDYGIETIGCCCGHGKVARSHIRISAQNIKLISLDKGLTVHLEFPYPRKSVTQLKI